MPSDEAMNTANHIFNRLTTPWSEEMDMIRDSVAQAIDNACMVAQEASIWCWASVNGDGPGYGTHIWGFSHTRENALKWASQGGELHAEGGRYSHVVMERVTPTNLYGDKDEVWFALPDKGAKVVPCEKPERLKNTICFTIG